VLCSTSLRILLGCGINVLPNGALPLGHSVPLPVWEGRCSVCPSVDAFASHERGIQSAPAMLMRSLTVSVCRNWLCCMLKVPHNLLYASGLSCSTFFICPRTCYYFVLIFLKVNPCVFRSIKPLASQEMTRCIRLAWLGFWIRLRGGTREGKGPPVTDLSQLLKVLRWKISGLIFFIQIVYSGVNCLKGKRGK
jgi:hypothetical protein